MTDEPLVVPVSPGSALVRLAEIAGALRQQPGLATALPAGTPSRLQTLRDTLWQALEVNQPQAIEAALRKVQEQLASLYEAVAAAHCTNAAAGTSAAPCAALGFPPPGSPLQPVDVATVIATFARPARQVLTTLAFRDAAGATAYWLQEIRCPEAGEILEDYILESNAPLFPRLRLPSGAHTFRVESRNNSEFVLSPEFVIEVP